MAKRSSYQTYVSGVNNAARGLWSGTITPGEFGFMMESALLYGIKAAFLEGAAAVGVAPNELVSSDFDRMQRETIQAMASIPNLAYYLVEHSKRNGYKLQQLQPRLQLWYNLYQRIRNLALAVVGANPKLKWVMGPTEKHCHDCFRLHNKVKRRSQWQAAGIYPRSHDLECKGFRCQCEFLPTAEPMSKGPLPKGAWAGPI